MWQGLFWKAVHGMPEREGEVRRVKRVGLGKVGDSPPKTALKDITNLGKI